MQLRLRNNFLDQKAHWPTSHIVINIIAFIIAISVSIITVSVTENLSVPHILLHCLCKSHFTFGSDLPSFCLFLSRKIKMQYGRVCVEGGVPVHPSARLADTELSDKFCSYGVIR